MPGLDIDAVVGQIRARPEWAHVRIIIFTASMDLEEVASRLGVWGFLEKPFKPAELVALLTPAASA